MLVVLAVDDFLASLIYGLCLLIGEQTQLVVGTGGSHFGNSKTLDEHGVFIEVEFADSEILDATECLDSV